MKSSNLVAILLNFFVAAFGCDTWPCVQQTLTQEPVLPDLVGTVYDILGTDAANCLESILLFTGFKQHELDYTIDPDQTNTSDTQIVLKGYLQEGANRVSAHAPFFQQIYTLEPDGHASIANGIYFSDVTFPDALETIFNVNTSILRQSPFLASESVELGIAAVTRFMIDEDLEANTVDNLHAVRVPEFTNLTGTLSNQNLIASGIAADAGMEPFGALSPAADDVYYIIVG